MEKSWNFVFEFLWEPCNYILFKRSKEFFGGFQKLGRDGAVPLSNSLSLADRHRMNHLVKQNNTKDVTEYCPFKYGEYPRYRFVVFVFNVPLTAKVIWRWGHGLKPPTTDWWSWGSNLLPLVYKASGLSTTPSIDLDARWCFFSLPDMTLVIRKVWPVPLQSALAFLN